MNDLLAQTQFEYFVRSFQTNCHKSKTQREHSWNKERDQYLVKNRECDKIFTMELREINAKNIKELIPIELSQDTTSTAYFELIVKQSFEIISKTSHQGGVTQSLIEKKEQLETKKRILNKYFEYILNTHLSYLIKGFSHLKNIETEFTLSFQQQQALKSKLLFIKRHYMLVSSKIMINKTKRRTLLSIHSNLIQLLKWKEEYSIVTNINNKTIKTFKEITSLIAYMKYSPYSSHSIICNKLIECLSAYQNHLNANFEEDIISSFLKLNFNINNLFVDFLLIKYKQNLISFISSCFKKSIFRIFKGTLLAYSDTNKDNIIINSNTAIQHMKDFALVSFDEKKLFSAFKCLWINISVLVSNYHSYMTKAKCSIISNNGKDNGITNFFDFNKELFSEILQTKLIKLLLMFDNCFTSFTYKQNIYQMLSSICVIGLIMQKGFCLNSYPEKIVSLFNNIAKKALRNECRRNIKRIGVFLNADLWKRTMIQNINDILLNQKNELEYHKKFFDILNYNSNSQEYHSWSIEDLKTLFNFDNLTEEYNMNKANILLSSTKIFTKPFNEIKTTFSSSSINTISCLLDCLSYIGIGNISIGEVYSYIFILFDYYIIASLNLFASQDTINSLLRTKVNVHNGKYSSLEDANKEVYFLKGYLTLISFIQSTIKKLEKMLRITITFKGNDKTTSKVKENNIQNGFFPNLTSEIYLDGNNPYCCLIETIICFETMITLKKFISRTCYLSQYAFGVKQMESYDEILKQVRELLYIPLCNNIFQYKSIISQLMLNQNWNVIESDAQSKFKDASLFVYNILDDTFEKFNNLTILSSDTLSESSKHRFFRCVIVFLVDSLMEGISQIDQWSSIGRSILLNDAKILKNNIQEIINGKNKDKSDDLFNMLIVYISAWYYNSNELLKYISTKSIPIHLITHILNTGIHITEEERYNVRKNIKKIAKGEIESMNKILSSGN